MQDVFIHNFMEDIKNSGDTQGDEDLELCPDCQEIMYPQYEDIGDQITQTGWKCLACIDPENQWTE